MDSSSIINDFDCKYPENTSLYIDSYRDEFKLILKHKDLNVNIQNNLGYTVLMFASEYENIFMIEQLLKHKNIDVSIQNAQGSDALEIALKHKRLYAAKLLTDFSKK